MAATRLPYRATANDLWRSDPLNQGGRLGQISPPVGAILKNHDIVAGTKIAMGEGAVVKQSSRSSPG